MCLPATSLASGLPSVSLHARSELGMQRSLPVYVCQPLYVSARLPATSLASGLPSVSLHARSELGEPAGRVADGRALGRQPRRHERGRLLLAIASQRRLVRAACACLTLLALCARCHLLHPSSHLERLSE